MAKKANKEDSEERRSRVFATVVYPSKEWLDKNDPECGYDGSDGYGSAPDDFMQIINDEHVAALVSPLHDKDVNPDGKIKKPSWHVMVIYDGMKSYETQVKPFFDRIGGVGREKIASKRGYARYLCHLDNPEKYQYDPAEVKEFGGASYDALVHLPTDDNRMLNDLFHFIRVNNILSLAEVIDITAKCNEDWNNMILTNKAYVVGEYIRSLEWEQTSGYTRLSERKLIDPKTGEVIDYRG